MSSIRMVTPVKSVDALFREAAKILYSKILYNLSYLGEDCVKRIRDRSGDESWFDQTGNLRSSIGYAIFSYGKKQIGSAFETVKEGMKGTSQGKKMIKDLAKLYSDTYALVVVAAMEYAECVEAMESKDVLASTEIYAKGKVNRILQKAMYDAEKEIQELEEAL